MDTRNSMENLISQVELFLKIGNNGVKKIYQR